LFKLSVTDTNNNVSADFAVTSLNRRPTAAVGADQTVLFSSLVTLDASASTDSDGTLAGYRWRQTAGTAVTLSDATAVSPTFTAPDQALTLQFQLTATDNEGLSDTQETTITVVSNFGVPGGGGGSLNWLSLCGIALLALRRFASRRP
jgi:hypothetical protein